MKLFISIDDTDNLESIGTGRLARMLADELVQRGLAVGTSVTRHQLLVHPDIPYTSHNSCACIAADSVNGDIEKIAVMAREFLKANFHQGANPGLCVVPVDAVPFELQSFGLRAQKEVIPLQEGKDRAAHVGFYTWWEGETGQGCIGALAGIGLRSSGNDGRFLALKGIREVTGVLSVHDVLSCTGILRVETEAGECIGHEDLINTNGWIRPTLRNGQPVLLVRKNGTYWLPAEKRKRDE